MELRLDGKRALVTGASSGLGRHFATVLAEAGADVALAARRADRLDDLAGELAAMGRRAAPVDMDVTDAESVEAGVAKAAERLGGLDILINNAGIAVTKPAEAHSEDDWQSVIDTNLSGAFRVARAVGSRMIDAGRGGRIVNIASLLGERPSLGVVAYCASKAGVVQMTKVLAYEWARHDIRVNAISPGYIRTDLNRKFLDSEAGRKMMRKVPLGRFGTPEDLDRPLLLLSGEGAAYITGAVLTADGGHALVTP